MDESEDWAFPLDQQPQTADVNFDLAAALDAVVQLRAEVPADAYTASILGTGRQGNGVVIREDGLTLTIGYLITEASAVWLASNHGEAVAAYPLAYDQVTGFGLVQPLGHFDVPALPLGSASACAIGDEAIVISHGGQAHALKARVLAKHEFAGYWEYVLDEAVFTTPAHPQWAGAALIDHAGRLLGIGSLLVQAVEGTDAVNANMIVPIDLLAPIYNDLLATGNARRAPRPWLGMYTSESDGKLIVVGVADKGPADQAGVRQGDVVTEVAGQRVESLATMFRSVWGLGPAGTEIVLTLSRGGDLLHKRLKSADRGSFLKKPSLH
ncbi:MAG: S1C family serine protease [Burkholderiales bacterium]